MRNFMKTLDGLEEWLPQIGGMLSLKESMMMSMIVTVVVECVKFWLTVGFLRGFDVTTNKYGSKAALLKKCSWCWWCGVVTSGPTAPQHTSKLIWHLVHLSLCVVDHLFLVGHLFPAIELEGCRTCCDIGQRAIIPLFQMWRNTFQLRMFGISWNITSPDIVLPCCRETVLSPNRSYLSRCLNASSIVLPQAWPERLKVRSSLKN